LEYTDIQSEKYAFEAKAMQEHESLVDSYVQYLNAKNYSPYTIKGRKSHLKAFSKYLIAQGLYDIAKLHIHTIWKFQADLSHSALRPSSVETRLYAVKDFLKHLSHQGHVSSGLCSLIHIQATKHTLPKDILSQQEMADLLDAPDVSCEKGVRDKAIMELMYSTGARRSEVINLNVEDVNTAKGLVKLKGKGNKEGFGILGNSACMWLRAYIRLARPVLIKDPADRALFVGNLSGTRIHKDSLYDLVKGYGKKAGIKRKVYPHILRHSMASHFILGGGASVDCQELLRHEELDTTQKYISITQIQLRSDHGRSHPRP
jgi:site-specific recombinase XerD